MLILDEPTEGVQPNIVDQIGEVLSDLNREGMTIFTIEQKVSFVKAYHDGFFLMDRGRIVAEGDMAELDQNLLDKYLLV